MNMQIQSSRWGLWSFCLVLTTTCGGAAIAQTGRIKILEIIETNAVLKVSEGNAVTSARSGMTVGAQAVICPAEAAINKVRVLLQPADGGDARYVVLGGDAKCPTVTAAWQQTTPSIMRWIQASIKFARREGGDTVRASASTAGSARGSVINSGDESAGGTESSCIAKQLQPLGRHAYVYLPEGKHALTFATSMRDGQIVEIVDSAGKVVATTQANNRRLELPMVDYLSKAEYTIRGGSDVNCNPTISVSAPFQSMRFEQALAVTPDVDTAKALYADEIMNTDDQAAWHAYALSMIKPSQVPGGVSGPESNASWEKWWAYWQAEAAKPVTQ